MRIALTGLFGIAAVGAGLYASGVPTTPAAQAEAVTIPAPASNAAETGGEAVAVFAGGCFWGLEGVFEHVAGVKSVTSGYAGGTQADANYDTVSDGRTGHAEAVRIVYDPTKVSYGQLLQVFFSVAHNPTLLDRQGPDHGHQYRSAIFPQSDEQRRVAAAYIAQLGAAHRFSGPIVTRLESGGFFPAEEHHQDFLRLHPDHPYIVANDAPKVADLRRTFPRLWSATPAA